MQRRVRSDLRAGVALATLAITLGADEGAALPTEFRIFTAGTVETTKGSFVFDADSIASVMAEYKAHGIDLMVDYAHASIDACDARDPAEAGKAAGWFNLEVRDGELWAVNVRWSTAAAAALAGKEWRFMSPAFAVKDGRIVSLLNVALTNIPATRKLEPLVAAARDLRTLSTGPAFTDVSRALSEALATLYPPEGELGCTRAWIADVFDASVVYELDGKLFEVSYTFDGSVATLGPTPTEVVRSYAPAKKAPPAASVAAGKNNRAIATLAGGQGMFTSKQIQEALDAIEAGDDAKCKEILKGLLASAAGAEPPPEGAPENAGAEGGEEKPEEIAAARTRLMRLAQKNSLVASIAQAEIWRASHLELEGERQKLASERKTFEAAERRKGCVDLVTCANRHPATVWADEKCDAPKAYLASMPIEAFREYVADAIKASGGTPPAARTAPTPPRAGAVHADGSKDVATKTGEVVRLSKRELDMCDELKIEPSDYAATKPKKVA